MRNVVLEQPGVVRLIDVDPPHAGPAQALVRLRAAGICGSDLAAYRGGSPLVRYPRVLGHELLVDVAECMDRPDLVGQRAVVEPLVRCGVCRTCRQGRYNCCVDLRVMGVHVDGGLRDVFAVDTRQLFPIPEGMGDDVAVLAEPTSIAYHAVQRSGIEAGQVALVCGAGAIGLLITQLLRRARGTRVLVSDVDPWRLTVAAGLGATPLRADRADLVHGVAEATDGEMADVVFEATGSATCTRLTTEAVAQGGRIVLIGWNKGPVEVDTVTLMRKEVDLLGSRNSANAFPSVVRLLADGVVDPARMITHHVALTEVDSALALLGGGQERVVKVVIHPS